MSKKATLDELRAAVASFRDERDWAQFHSPKNLAILDLRDSLGND